MKRAVTITAILLAIVVGIGFRFMTLRQQALAEFAEHKAESVARGVARVKQGWHSAGVDYSEMLSVLAQDPDCVANLTNIDFCGDVSPEDAPQVAALTNVKSMFFYCTDPSLVLPYAKDLPIEEVIFELVLLTPADVEALGTISTLKRVRFQSQGISGDELQMLRQLPDRIELDLDDCTVEGLAKEPANH